MSSRSTVRARFGDPSVGQKNVILLGLVDDLARRHFEFKAQHTVDFHFLVSNSAFLLYFC